MVCPCCNLDACPEKGACCIDGQCVDYVSESECSDLGGAWQGCCSRCHPSADANTGSVTFPCGDTSTPTCCDAFAARYSQVVISLSGLAAGPFPNFGDCSCMNSTYVFDIDIAPPANSLFQQLVDEQIPGALSDCPFTQGSDVWCQITCRSQNAASKLSLFLLTFNREIQWQYERPGAIENNTVVLPFNVFADGDVCITTCEDLVDAIQVSISVTPAGPNPLRCDTSNATSSVTFQ
jgi:hypothetical protein